MNEPIPATYESSTKIHHFNPIGLFGLLALQAATFRRLSRSSSPDTKNIRTSLAADDRTQTKGAAGSLGEAGADVSKSESPDRGRGSFAQLSQRAEKLVGRQPGYYVVYCAMATKSWVQTLEKVSNPYFGKKDAQLRRDQKMMRRLSG